MLGVGGPLRRQKLAHVDAERIGDLLEGAHGGRLLGMEDRAQLPTRDVCQIGEHRLRHLPTSQLRPNAVGYPSVVGVHFGAADGRSSCAEKFRNSETPGLRNPQNEPVVGLPPSDGF